MCSMLLDLGPSLNDRDRRYRIAVFGYHVKDEHNGPIGLDWGEYTLQVVDSTSLILVVTLTPTRDDRMIQLR